MRDYATRQRILGYLLEEKAARNRDRVFICFRDQEITFGQVDEMANRVANGFLRLGIRKGDAVCVMLSNCPEYIYTWFGLAKIGAIEVAFNTAYQGDALKYVINLSDAKAIVADGQFVGNINAVGNDLPKVQKLVVYAARGGPQAPKTRFDTMAYEALLGAGTDKPQGDVDYRDVLTLSTTSGTTGPSKLVITSHHFLYDWVKELCTAMRLTREDVLYNCLPWVSLAGHMVTYMALFLEAKHIIGEGFKAETFWNDMRKYGVTWLTGMEFMARSLYSLPRTKDDASNPVKTWHVMPSPVDFYEDFERRFDIKFFPYYGQAEMGIVAYCPMDAPKVGSVGKPKASLEAKIVDDDEREVPIGEAGELILRPRQPWIMMSGYYNMPRETAEAFRNLWFHTGDIMYYDEDGYLYFVGRKKDAIEKKERKVFGYEIERIVNTHPLVQECAALATAIALGEDEIKLLVVPKGKQQIAPGDLIKFCESRLPSFAVPRFVEIMEQLPKTPYGKIEKYKLAATITPSTWDREKG